jgi:hypothetical protein
VTEQDARVPAFTPAASNSWELRSRGSRVGRTPDCAAGHSPLFVAGVLALKWGAKLKGLVLLPPKVKS